MIPTFDAGRLPDHPPGPREPQIELVILITHQLLVKEANPVKYLTGPTPEIDRIHQASVVRVMPPCTAARKSRLKCRRHRLSYVSRPLRYPWSPHVIRPGLL